METYSDMHIVLLLIVYIEILLKSRNTKKKLQIYIQELMDIVYPNEFRDFEQFLLVVLPVIYFE